ncbi:thiamine phosphate synthase [Fodinibius salsisoli]|uniref:Thiamine-phosphate synthase n=1 Tax=Fodinibius salsisoli TaxID=2820877 RepID=A0ABT3PMG5_9BACT|nr:thiamine phosphate synthase [Fodinibius salsisoli]MCW9706963.1 thiamine phosphate synthase [Fodinibius salsisoli]
MSEPNFRYYLITNRKACAPRSLPQVVEEACRAGIGAVQLREKDLPDHDLYQLATEVREITARYNTHLFINGRPDIASAVGANGMHCRESGLSPSDIRKHWPDLSIGASVHSKEAAKRAEKEGADFLLFGPVFFTPSKARYGEPQGLEKLQAVVDAVQLPIFGVGGVRPDRVEPCLQSGAYGVAGISSIMAADSVRQKVDQWKSILNKL